MMLVPFWRRLGDKIGHKSMILRSLIALALSQFLFYFIINPWLIILICVLQGLFSGFIISAQAYAISGIGSGSRSEVLSYLQAATASGSLIGPLVGGAIMDKYSFGIICIISSLLCVLCFISILFLPEINEKEKTDNPVKIKNHRWIYTIMTIIILMQLAKTVPHAFFSLYVVDTFNLSNSITGLIYSSSVLTLAITAPLWGNFLSKRNMKKKIFYIEIIVWICSLTLIASAITSNWVSFMLYRMLWGIWQGALLPVAHTLIVEHCQKQSYGYYLVQGNRASKAGVLSGTLTGGVMISIVGIAYGFWFVAICYSMSGFYVRYVREASTDKGGL